MPNGWIIGYLFDSAVTLFGNNIEAKLMEYDTKTNKYKYTLDQLLRPVNGKLGNIEASFTPAYRRKLERERLAAEAEANADTPLTEEPQITIHVSAGADGK